MCRCYREAMGLFSRGNKNNKVRKGSLEEYMRDAAADLVEAFRGYGSPVRDGELDYSAGSMHTIDRVLGDFYDREVALPEDLHFMASAYVFEVARNQFGGKYKRLEGDNSYVLVIGEPEFAVGVMAMEKVSARVTNGPEDNFPFFYEGIAPLVERKESATLV